jgi:hypothetical protein
MNDGTRAVEPTSALGHLRADAQGIVHMTTARGVAVTSSLCGSRNQHITGGALTVDKPPPVDWPTCVYYVAYKTAKDPYMHQMYQLDVVSRHSLLNEIT